jgi:hypothetical protein
LGRPTIPRLHRDPGRQQHGAPHLRGHWARQTTWGGNLSDGDGSDGPAFDLTSEDGQRIPDTCLDAGLIERAIRREIARLKGAK